MTHHGSLSQHFLLILLLSLEADHLLSLLPIPRHLQQELFLQHLPPLLVALKHLSIIRYQEFNWSIFFCLTSHSRNLIPHMANITHFNALNININKTYVHEYALSVIEKHFACLIVRCTHLCLLLIENFIIKSIEFQKCWVPLVLVFQLLLLVSFSFHPKPFEACVLTQSSSWSPKYAPTPFSLLIRTYTIY